MKLHDVKFHAVHEILTQIYDLIKVVPLVLDHLIYFVGNVGFIKSITMDELFIIDDMKYSSFNRELLTLVKRGYNFSIKKSVQLN